MAPQPLVGGLAGWQLLQTPSGRRQAALFFLPGSQGWAGTEAVALGARGRGDSGIHWVWALRPKAPVGWEEKPEAKVGLPTHCLSSGPTQPWLWASGCRNGDSELQSCRETGCRMGGPVTRILPFPPPVSDTPTPWDFLFFIFWRGFFAWHPTRAGSVGRGVTEVAMHLGQDKCAWFRAGAWFRGAGPSTGLADTSTEAFSQCGGSPTFSLFYLFFLILIY